MAESKKARKERLLKMRRKYKLGEFAPKAKKNKTSKKLSSKSRSRKKVSRSTNKQIKRTVNKRMVKRKKSRSRSSSSKKMITSGLMNNVVSGGLYAVGKPLIDMGIDKVVTTPPTTNMREFMTIGVALALKYFVKNKIVTNFADASIIIGTYNLARQYTEDWFSSTTTPATTASYNNAVSRVVRV
jgi:hypothetical protein